MAPLHALLLNNGLLDQPILLIEPHRSPHGIWRIKFAYDDFEPLSMDAQQASQLAIAFMGSARMNWLAKSTKRSGARHIMKPCSR